MARWSPLALVVALLAAVGLYGSTAAVAAAPLTVAQAIATRTVRGDRPRVRRRRTHRHDDGHPFGFYRRHRAGPRRLASRPAPRRWSTCRSRRRTGPRWAEDQPVAAGQADRRHGHAERVLLARRAHLADGVRVRRHDSADQQHDHPADHDGPPRPARRYYAAACGKSGAALKSALNTIIRTQTKLSYDAVWEALKVTDQDPANSANVILLYSGTSQCEVANGGDQDDWNREHVWAKSHGDFGTSAGPGTDLHHLRPEDVTVNAARGNLDFDNGGSAVSRRRPATRSTPTRGSRATRSRATSPA